MNVKQIQAECDAIAHLMEAKGFEISSCDLLIEAFTQPRVCLKFKPLTCNNSWDREYSWHRNDDPAEAFKSAKAWLAAQPSIQERKQEAVIKLTARAIDAAREIGMDEAFLQPILAMMKTLSENVITMAKP